MNRIGIGYDIHKLVEGRKLILGGVEIPFEKGLLGHSDGDALLHAIADALLGAASLGDIGQHFPDNDPAYKNADSKELLKTVAKLISENGYQVVNIDSNIIIQKPKLAPYLDKMSQTIAEILNIEQDQVNVKARSNEGLGDIGQGLAAATQAVVIISRG
ncbi:MAG: 2-C-methyl-D-erythritol 2,4-cyclodiphosphate synthase [Pseudomonadota bacterium]